MELRASVSGGRGGPDGLLAPGSTVGDYQVNEFIASGGFGSVYKVRDTVRGRGGALKVLHPELSVVGDQMVRFLREAELLKFIDHPNVIQTYDSGFLSDGRAYLVMELLDGEDLEEHLERNGPRGLPETIEILRPVCDALDHAHGRGIIHRDIKASNVFLDEQGDQRRIVLLDFGIAKVIEAGGLDLTTSRMLVGTPTSMAPEQIRREAIDARTDVYSLGALAYHMLSGRLPFFGSSRTVLQYMHLHGPRPRVKGHGKLTNAVDKVVSRAMAPAPGDRYASAAEFLDALRELQNRAKGRSRKPRQPQQSAVGVYVDVRVRDSGSADEDELMDAMEAALASADSHFSEDGFAIAFEDASSTLFARALGEDSDAQSCSVREALDSAVELGRELAEQTPPYLHVNICVHKDGAFFRDDQVRGGELMRLERWAPTDEIEGVVATLEALDGLDRATEQIDDCDHLLRLRYQTEILVEAPDPEEARAQRLLHTEMMARIGRQAAGLVHDLKSPITATICNLESVLANLNRGEPFGADDREALEDAMAAILQARETTTTVLNASAVRSYERSRHMVSVCEVIESAVSLTDSETRPKASVDVEHSGDFYVLGSRGRLAQVLINLLSNAADAIADCGRISVRTGTSEEGAVEISVRDTGIGISEAIKNHIFEPFFTTKEPGQGTGLGLAQVRDIVHEHGGSIDVDSTPGAGTCFTISLPTALGPAAPVNP